MTRSPLYALLALALACAGAPAAISPAEAPAAPVRYRADEVPAPLAPAAARGEAAIRALRERLAARLAAATAAGGPMGALGACAADARTLAADVAAQTGVTVGRTSARLRDGRNAPPGWAAPVVAEASARRAADAPVVVVDLGDRVAVLRPIAAGAACLACHGGPERVAPEVKAAIAAAYPLDEATGYAEGDLRGFFWAEAPK